VRQDACRGPEPPMPPRQQSKDLTAKAAWAETWCGADLVESHAVMCNRALRDAAIERNPTNAKIRKEHRSWCPWASVLSIIDTVRTGHDPRNLVQTR
jgi:hypothetical protein